MARLCSICAHPAKNRINEQLVDETPFVEIAKEYGLSLGAINRHRKKHLPAAAARSGKAVVVADGLMDRLAELNSKAEDVYQRSLALKNYTAAIGAVRELRGLTELYAKITGELQAQTVNFNNITISPEWVSLRSAILNALAPYPDAHRAVVLAIGDGKC